MKTKRAMPFNLVKTNQYNKEITNFLNEASTFEIILTTFAPVLVLFLLFKLFWILFPTHKYVYGYNYPNQMKIVFKMDVI